MDPKIAYRPSTSNQPTESNTTQLVELIVEATTAQPAEPTTSADETLKNASTITKEKTSTTSEANKEE